ncbi:hypothetical protein CRUP_028230 [Coryphaenoides rupestris]|nr:hypothetical protein CRUP_028230 [Coryphaenoides rupestris]
MAGGHERARRSQDDHTNLDVAFQRPFNIDCTGFDTAGGLITADKNFTARPMQSSSITGTSGRICATCRRSPAHPVRSGCGGIKSRLTIPRRLPPPTTSSTSHATNRTDATVWAPYGSLSQRKVAEDFKLPPKTSYNWKDRFVRVKFYNELKKHIHIHTFGGAFGKRISSDEGSKIITSCKFYLSFENSIYKDYMTEKLFNPMFMQTVPIVLGPSRRNYEEHIPSDSFIHYEDLPVEKLVDKLNYLDKNETAYMSYFAWRRNFEPTPQSFSKDHLLDAYGLLTPGSVAEGEAIKRSAMLSFATQTTLHQRVAFGVFILLVFLACLFVYSKDMPFNYDLFSVPRKQDAPLYRQRNNTPMVQGPVTQEHRWQEVTNAPAVPKTIVLIWMWPFNAPFNIDCTGFDTAGGLITADRKLYGKADAVFFHHRDIRSDMRNMPQEPRPPHQKWVWWNKESPANSSPIAAANNLFNLTCNYRTDATVWAPYGSLSQRKVAEDFKLPPKDKLVCWIVSNWQDRFVRVKFYNELKKHIHIHTFGGAFGKRVSSDEGSKIITSCKFYLSFENSIYKDYMTEKLFKPMFMQTVPIVLGPSRRNYEEHIPSDSFIHYEDLPVEKLVDKLNYLDKNETAYMSYFAWRQNFESKPQSFDKDVCLVSQYLKHAPGYQTVTDLNKWYWG